MREVARQLTYCQYSGVWHWQGQWVKLWGTNFKHQDKPSLLGMPARNVSAYNGRTRSKGLFIHFKNHNKKYYNSFFPYFARLYEKSIQNEPDNLTFKEKIKIIYKPRKYRHLNYGTKYSNSLWCHLRIGHSFLKGHSFSHGLSDTDRCPNCNNKETVSHYFSCYKYKEQRNLLDAHLSNIIPRFDKLSLNKKVNIYLNGYNLSSTEFDCRNITIALSVQKFILTTKRFSVK